MQISNLYSIYDRKAGYYLPLFQKRSEAEAIREFTECVKMHDGPIAQYPSDFELCELGQMDLDTGEILPAKNARVIMNGLSCLQAAHAERKAYEAALSSQPKSKRAAAKS